MARKAGHELGCLSFEPTSPSDRWEDLVVYPKKISRYQGRLPDTGRYVTSVVQGDD